MAAQQPSARSERQSRPRRVELIYGTCGCMMPCSCVEFDGKRYRSVVEVVGTLDAQRAVDRSDELSWLQTEIARQDVAMGGGYPPDRDGVRMAISSLEDEVEEVKLAWRGERSGSPQPHGTCGPTCDRSHAWRQTRVEALQVAAIALRLVRDLREDRE